MHQSSTPDPLSVFHTKLNLFSGRTWLTLSTCVRLAGAFRRASESASGTLVGLPRSRGPELIPLGQRQHRRLHYSGKEKIYIINSNIL